MLIRDKDDSGIYEYGVLDGLIKNEDEIANTINMKKKPKLAPVQEVVDVSHKIRPLATEEDQSLQKQNFKKKGAENYEIEKKNNFFSSDNITQGNIKNMTTDSFFKEGNLQAQQLGFKDANKNPISSAKQISTNNPKKPAQLMGKQTAPVIPPSHGSRIKTPSPVEMPDAFQESLLVQQSKKKAAEVVERIENEAPRVKIKNETLSKDLNCTLNESSILDVFADENGYLIDNSGQLIYDDLGKVIRLTDEQIENFKQNDLYEEVEC